MLLKLGDGAGLTVIESEIDDAGLRHPGSAGPQVAVNADYRSRVADSSARRYMTPFEVPGVTGILGSRCRSRRSPNAMMAFTGNST